MELQQGRDEDFQYDVALSFAGENRDFVECVAECLRDRGVRVFYDDYEKVQLWGKDLYEHLDFIYQRAARYCVVFISSAYAEKVWTNHERKSAQARAIQEAAEYVLPFRFDNTEIPGIRPTVGYLSAGDVGAEELAELIVQKLGPRVRRNYFPPNPTALYAALDATSADEQEAVFSIAASFMQSLKRMSKEERALIGTAFAIGCHTEMPDNVHVQLDLLRRELGTSIAEIESNLRGLTSLGLEVEKRESDDDHDGSIVVVRWNDYTMYAENTLESDFSFERSTEIANAMLSEGLDHYCLQCATERIIELDFSGLAGEDANE